MPNIKSAIKRMRQNQTRRGRNRQRRSRMRGQIKEFRELVEAKKLDEAKQSLSSVYAVVDRTAQLGAIHANTAARYKSRLSKYLSQAG